MRVVTVNQCGEIRKYLLVDGALCPLNQALPLLIEKLAEPWVDRLMTPSPWYKKLKRQTRS